MTWIDHPKSSLAAVLAAQAGSPEGVRALAARCQIAAPLRLLVCTGRRL